MKNFKRCLFLTIVLFLFAAPTLSFAITVDQLKETLTQKDRIAIIDLRSRLDYAQGHILDAINIPSRLLMKKQLPPLGEVIVYGDGIKKDDVDLAVEELNTRPGINADFLEGGYPAWSAKNLSRSPWFGIKRQLFSSINYQDLKKADSASNPDMVIVDLRYVTHDDATKTNNSNDTGQDDLSDLNDLFPNLNVIKPNTHFSISKGQSERVHISGLSSIPDHDSTLYVLIDMGDGTAQKVARRLKEKRIQQIAILIGGEKILQRKGQSGLDSKVTEF
ncbi:MAG: rhodanese-like domain-containing protein [Desulfobacterales bacterium]|nr:rhodanese-like domain-containing protein [Desulfobacterales bacterium]